MVIAYALPSEWRLSSRLGNTILIPTFISCGGLDLNANTISSEYSYEIYQTSGAKTPLKYYNDKPRCPRMV